MSTEPEQLRSEAELTAFRGVLSDRYTILRPLSTGDTSLVYEVEHIELRRRCAAKLLRRPFCDDPLLKKALLEEGRVLAALRHPNLLEVIDFGEHPSFGAYLVVELLQGETLQELLDREGRLTAERGLPIFDGLLAALQAMHERGVIHRDLNPSHIMITQLPEGGTGVKVIDFGVAREALLDDDQRTEVGQFEGAPGFSAPEQLRGELTVDRRIDIYSAGCVLYTTLAGRAPFIGPRIEYVLGGAPPLPPPLAALAPDVPEWLCGVVSQAMAPSRDDRFSSAADMREALRFEEEPTRIEPYPVPPPPSSQVSRLTFPPLPPPAPPGLSWWKKLALSVAAAEILLAGIGLIRMAVRSRAKAQTPAPIAALAVPLEEAKLPQPPPLSPPSRLPPPKVTVRLVVPAGAEVRLDDTLLEGELASWTVGTGPHRIEVREAGAPPVERVLDDDTTSVVTFASHRGGGGHRSSHHHSGGNSGGGGTKLFGAGDL